MFLIGSAGKTHTCNHYCLSALSIKGMKGEVSKMEAVRMDEMKMIIRRRV